MEFAILIFLLGSALIIGWFENTKTGRKFANWLDGKLFGTDLDAMED